MHVEVKSNLHHQVAAFLLTGVLMFFLRFMLLLLLTFFKTRFLKKLCKTTAVVRDEFEVKFTSFFYHFPLTLKQEVEFIRIYEKKL